MKDTLLLIFTRNPELGKVKTRLAKGVGEKNALAIYIFLLEHTYKVTKNLSLDKAVYYSNAVAMDDIWSKDPNYTRKAQTGEDLGARMEHAFTNAFAMGYKKVLIIGSDLYDITAQEIENAALQLEQHPVVIGPATDGGYYLLGLKHIPKNIFKNKAWGTNSVLKDTLLDIEKSQNTYRLLTAKNDIDTIADITDIPVFSKYIN